MLHPTAFFRRKRAALLGVLGVLSAAAYSLAGPEHAPAAAEVPADWHELLRLDDDARRFFSSRVPRNTSEAERVDAIVDALLDPGELGFTYREDGTFAARETFRRRQGDCVAFSILLVAVAREYGLVARFNEVRTEPQWDRVGQVVAEFRHLNVVVRTETGNVMLDLLPTPGAGGALTVARPVSDAHAFAMFYSNIGVQRLGARDPAGAQPLLELATQIAPGYAVGWVNLGSLHALRGDTVAARACYERALREEPRELKAIAALAPLYRASGETARAEALERKTERYRERNPYYLASLARRELATGELSAAEKRLRRALALKDDEPEFLELAVAAARRLGHERDAEAWSARLAQLRAEKRTPAPLQAGSAPVGP
ncbi:MAG TPA: transglutaminase domain-containing protein [Opitutaceae bacterium]|nr:transglutaminase domain-containing protein [Opitutaceae bacterium]